MNNKINASKTMEIKNKKTNDDNIFKLYLLRILVLKKKIKFAFLNT